MQKDEDHSFRKVKLRVDEVQGKNCLTNFHGMDFTQDKLRSLVRKWQSLIEANAVVKTTDDYLVRLFAIAFTKRRPNQIKKTTYARASQIRAIRKKMTDIMAREASSCTLTQLVTKLIPEVMGREIEKSTQGIYPLQNVRNTLSGDHLHRQCTNFGRSATSARSSSSSSPSSTLATSSPSTASRTPTTLARRSRATASSRSRCWRACKQAYEGDGWHDQRGLFDARRRLTTGFLAWTSSCIGAGQTAMRCCYIGLQTCSKAIFISLLKVPDPRLFGGFFHAWDTMWFSVPIV